ncbi:TspO/MBR family protein [Xanthomarina sp.]|uniref:TspO/MBR family protein n=1 Tax=Xanthomarina sp. TaxID=1931211 RepID=UPI002BC7617B|nr:TspO/MBR family protein [Xanthomarina sp.]HLV40562.1 TspO/MBR family protein [Xanthomarina sp.]
MKTYQLIILFLIINFAALGIGSWLMGNGPTSEWYLIQNKAPWTPPGWVFGAAWTGIMICFSFYMANLVKQNASSFVLGLFAVQFLLNVSWNYIFFNQHLITFGLVVIILLTLVVAVFLFKYKSVLQTKTWLIAPYFIWLLIATSLNAYILLYN